MVVLDIAKSDLPHYAQARHMSLDVTDRQAVMRAPIAPGDMVYNLSAKMLSPIQVRAKRHDFFYPVNYDGTKHIIEAMDRRVPPGSSISPRT